MTRWRVTFEIDLPTDKYNQACESIDHIIDYAELRSEAIEQLRAACKAGGSHAQEG